MSFYSHKKLNYYINWILKYDQRFSSIIIVKNFCEHLLEEVELVLVLVVLADVAFEGKKLLVYV